jgi:hypothetical protein
MITDAALAETIKDHRSSERISIQFGKVSLRQTGAKSIQVAIDDLSLTGCRVEWPHHANVGDRLWVTIGNLEALAAIVAWTEGFRVGCRFEVSLHPSVFNALIVPPERPAIQSKQQKFSNKRVEVDPLHKQAAPKWLRPGPDREQSQ